MKRYLAILAGALLLAPAAVLAATTPAGVWEGTIQTPNGDLGVVFNLHRDGDKWAGEADVPMQGVSGLPLINVKVDGAAISFALPAVPGDPHYEGKLSEDGKTISGNFSQGGATLPLDLKWKSEPRAVEKAPANVGDVQALEGAWEGTMDANGNAIHLRFNFTKNADGSVKATLDVASQSISGLAFNSIARTGDAVKMELKVLGASYEGTLNKDASAMTGTWSQGGGSLPLTVQRKQDEKKN
jgi:uncharacterized protein